MVAQLSFERGRSILSGKYISSKASVVRSTPGIKPIFRNVARPTKGCSIEIALMTAYLPIRSGLALTPVNTPSNSSLFAFIVYIFQEELPKLDTNCEGLLIYSKSNGIVTP